MLHTTQGLRRPGGPSLRKSSFSSGSQTSWIARAGATAKVEPYPPPTREVATDAPTDVLYDAVIVGGGMGGLTTAAKLVEKGAKVLVLEKYLVPGGSAAHYKREGYTFDVGSSMMFGFGDKGTTNLITKALQSVGRRLQTVPDPSQVHYHLPASKQHPQGLEVRVWRAYDDFVAELTQRFPHEAAGIAAFYGECWRVFNALNSLELKSLEEPRYLLGQFARNPIACLTLASFLITNTGDVARRHISDPELLRFIDAECYIWSTVNAAMTPMINAGMVFCDRHFGGINYPLGGVGRIAEEMAAGIEERGGRVLYRANVKEIITEVAQGEQPASSSGGGGSGGGDEAGLRATGVRLADGRVYRGRVVVSNATRWDTFEGLVGQERMPRSEQLFRKRYKKSPSFLSIHMGVRADVRRASERVPAAGVQGGRSPGSASEPVPAASSGGGAGRRRRGGRWVRAGCAAAATGGAGDPGGAVGAQRCMWGAGFRARRAGLWTRAAGGWTPGATTGGSGWWIGGRSEASTCCGSG